MTLSTTTEAAWKQREVDVKIETLVPAAQNRLVTVGNKAQLTEAAVCLANGNTHLLVVCDDAGIICGVVSKTDIVSRICNCRGSSCMEMVAALMTREIICCRPDDTLNDVWSLKENGFTHTPIVDDTRRPVGMLTARDVLQALLGEVEHEEALLHDYVMGIGYR